jgi:hypothetical protein
MFLLDVSSSKVAEDDDEDEIYDDGSSLRPIMPLFRVLTTGCIEAVFLLLIAFLLLARSSAGLFVFNEVRGLRHEAILWTMSRMLLLGIPEPEEDVDLEYSMSIDIFADFDEVADN